MGPGCLHLRAAGTCYGFGSGPQLEPLCTVVASGGCCQRTGVGSGPLQWLFSVAHGVVQTRSQTSQGRLSDPCNIDLTVCSRGLLPVELYHYACVSLISSPACSVLLTRMSPL